MLQNVLRRFPPVAALAAIAAALLIGTGVAAYVFVQVLSPGSKVSQPAPRDLVLIVSGDTAGWIVPCGCASNQSGGLLRRGSFVAQQKELGEVVVVDAGGAAAGTSVYDRLKFEAILRGELALGTYVHNLGGPELALGVESLRTTSQSLGLEFLSANARDSNGALIGAEFKLVEAAGRRILLIGVVSRKFATADIHLIEPQEAILSVLHRQSGPFDAVIVLAYVPEAELRELAAALPEVHAVVGGPTGQSLAPTNVGPGWLASATNKGKFLVRFQWKRDAGALQGDVVEITDRFADDAAQTENLRAFWQLLSLRDLSAAETGLVDAAANRQDDFQLAGSQSCQSCHEAEFASWQSSSHSHAWHTLMDSEAQFDAYCQQCHTTGFGLPGGFVSARRSADRVDVGCESCHGPSQAHVRNPETRTPFSARDQCVRCHDRENSPEFAWASYWAKIQHGPKTQK